LASFAARYGLRGYLLRRALRQFATLGACLQFDPTRGVRFLQPVTSLSGRFSPKYQRRFAVQENIFSLDSTNTRLLDELGRGLNTCKALTAEVQTRGRGRRERVWQSALGAGITLSLALPQAELTKLQLTGGALPLSIGVALAEALVRLGVRDVGLKWPNDVQVNGRKLGGILLEGRAAGVVVGIGLNHALARFPRVPMPGGGQGSLQTSLGQPIISLRDVLGARLPARSKVVAAVLATLFQKLEENFTHWQKAFARFDVLYGREIQVHEADGHYWYGVAQGVNEAGLLRVLHPEGERLCHAGEVSIRQHPERAGGQDAFIG
jgi:BirA family biotin operon repressor/biotin-[acetyl-CoA-carboxylase] ligase